MSYNLPFKQKINCTYNEILSVSGAGLFTFCYGEGFLYVTDQGTSQDGVMKIYDMADPFTPTLVSTTALDTDSNPTNPYWTAEHPDLLFVPYQRSSSPKVDVWDVSDRANPVRLSQISCTGLASACAAIGNVLCISIGGTFLQPNVAETWDISDPSAPSALNLWVQGLPLRTATMVRASDTNFFFTGQHNSGGPFYLAVRDIDLNAVDYITHPAAFNSANDLILNEDFTVCFIHGLGGSNLNSYDISDPSDLSLIQNYNSTMSFASSEVLCYSPLTKILYVGRGGGGGVSGPIGIFDVSDPSDMSRTGTINTAGETVSAVCLITDGCAGLAWGQGTGAAIHLIGTPPTS